MSEPFIGEVRIFAGDYAPEGWLFCNGQQLNVAQYQALYSVIGNIYGGTAGKTFNLPDLRGRAPVAQGEGPGLKNRVLGKGGGESTVMLDTTQMPSHRHGVLATNAAGKSNDPTGRIWAKYGGGASLYSTTNDKPVNMSSNALGLSGSQPLRAHSNIQPYLGINFIIAVEGEYPVKS